ncbi:MAG: hypothetical protein ACJAXJ_000994 [Colwellia sp.]|jgi:hypothetical protein
MNKFTVIFIFITSLVLSNTSNATLITDPLTSANYVTYVGDGITIDFAWASIVNTEYWGDPSLVTTNRLYAPDLHQGWDYATENDLDILFANFVLDDFDNKDGTYIQAVSFWNSIFDDIVTRETIPIKGVLTEFINKANLSDYNRQTTSSSLLLSGIDGVGIAGANFETFYVRKTNTSTPVPEPSTLMIFSLGLIALVSKKRLFS